MHYICGDLDLGSRLLSSWSAGYILFYVCVYLYLLRFAFIIFIGTNTAMVSNIVINIISLIRNLNIHIAPWPPRKHPMAPRLGTLGLGQDALPGELKCCLHKTSLSFKDNSVVFHNCLRKLLDSFRQLKYH